MSVISVGSVRVTLNILLLLVCSSISRVIYLRILIAVSTLAIFYITQLIDNFTGSGTPMLNVQGIFCIWRESSFGRHMGLDNFYPYQVLYTW